MKLPVSASALPGADNWFGPNRKLYVSRTLPVYVFAAALLTVCALSVPGANRAPANKVVAQSASRLFPAARDVPEDKTLPTL